MNLVTPCNNIVKQYLSVWAPLLSVWEPNLPIWLHPDYHALVEGCLTNTAALQGV